MFPQVERRSILWDLQRNGGNIQSTTERILAGRLETVWFSCPPLVPEPINYFWRGNIANASTN